MSIPKSTQVLTRLLGQSRHWSQLIPATAASQTAVAEISRSLSLGYVRLFESEITPASRSAAPRIDVVSGKYAPATLTTSERGRYL